MVEKISAADASDSAKKPKRRERRTLSLRKTREGRRKNRKFNQKLFGLTILITAVVVAICLFFANLPKFVSLTLNILLPAIIYVPYVLAARRRHQTVEQALGKFYVLLLLIETYFVGTATQYLLSLIFLFILGEEELSLPIWNAVYQAVTYCVIVAIIIGVPYLLNKKYAAKKSDACPTREALGLSGLPTWTDTGLAPIAAIIFFIIAYALDDAFSNFSWYDANQVQNTGFTAIYGYTDRMIAFIALVVVAPIAEEIIFRGWLYGKLRKHMNTITVPVLLVSLVFAIMHGQWNVGVNVFALSLVLCALREITGTIYAGILLHMIKNCLAYAVLYVVGYGLMLH